MCEMKTFAIVLAVAFVASLCDPTKASPGRVRRQWSWGEWTDDERPRPSRQTTATVGTTQAPVPSGTPVDIEGPAFLACYRGCPTTPQYNPVCGSNGVTYDNMGKLNCANRCGANVSMTFGGACNPLRR